MKQILIRLTLLVSLLGVNAMANADCDELYNHQFKTLDGKPFNLCDYQDKPILVVNTASKCGFTPQFEALEDMYKAYQSQGLLVIGFPSNDFKQDPGDNKQIGDFCKMTYGVEFPMMSKSAVRGDDANPFYAQLIEKTGTSPKWNFYKYVIAPGGKKVIVFSSLTKPDSAKVLKEITPYLK
ncbi:MAG: glutathione peroxidase [Methylophilaceae bacterium]